jgi:hypothetical protein
MLATGSPDAVMASTAAAWADSLDEAKAALRAAWERPLSFRKSGRDMLTLSLSAHDPPLTLACSGPIL